MVDYLIIGQGIAGSMLTWFLTKANQKVFLIDEFHPNSASQVATGVINPITGKRLVKSWRIDELLPFAKNTYTELEHELGIKLLSETRIHRIFSNPEDFQFFRQKNELGELPENIKPLIGIPACFQDAHLGGIEIHGVYLLNYQFLLAAMRKKFLENNMLAEEKFEQEQLHFENGKVIYKNMEASKIIFCEGSSAGSNSFFQTLPYNFAKGEALTVEIPGFNQTGIWHKGIFITPLANELYRVGATYDWDFPDALPSEKGKAELEKKLKRAINIPYKVVDHVAAIRPTVKDRRPLIGVHPENNQVGIFNGMGTKGASLAPYFAKQFADFLTTGKCLDEEVDVARIISAAERSK
ncbi:MAG: FAD-binding oxidoreductase [Chitinophagales bacterium]|nr:FAD-binding oxidoreductase [Chitinophagales bacterium]